ncbi:MAG: hypothetical protein PHF67_03365 [Candidatus Nanoarchaeia archaeon]|nr:hypothetical protein [Candidatus Nanoarchaeia archaeon]
MLTIKAIQRVRRMMEQTGGEGRGFYQDHLGSEQGPALPANYVPRPGQRTIKPNLVYECFPDGDVRIVNRRD